MDEVTFNEQDIIPNKTRSQTQPGGPLTRWLMARKLVRDEKQANMFMLGIVGVIVVLSVVVWVIMHSPSVTGAKRPPQLSNTVQQP